MKNSKLLDLYSDSLIHAFGETTATGFSSRLNGEISHDQVQRSLASAEESSADLWMKGINFVTCLYHNQGLSLPVGFEMVRKPNAKVIRGPATLGEGLRRASIEQRKIKSLSMTVLVGLDAVNNVLPKLGGQPCSWPCRL